MKEHKFIFELLANVTTLSERRRKSQGFPPARMLVTSQSPLLSARISLLSERRLKIRIISLTGLVELSRWSRGKTKLLEDKERTEKSVGLYTLVPRYISYSRYTHRLTPTTV